MQIYTAHEGCQKAIQKFREENIGILLTASWNISVNREHHRELPVALDNGAFANWQKGRGFDEFIFLKCISECLRHGIDLNFIVCPDLVAKGKDSLEFSLMWEKRLQGHSLYLAVQDGMIEEDLFPHLYKFKGLFIGGTLDWKYQTAPKWVKLAHEYGMKCHIARIGTESKMNWANRIEADSIDSSSIARNKNLNHYYRHKEAVEKQLTTF